MRTELVIRNQTGKTMTFYLEPWGGLYTVESERAVKVVVESPQAPSLELEFGQQFNSVIVADPPGAIASVYDGEVMVKAV